VAEVQVKKDQNTLLADQHQERVMKKVEASLGVKNQQEVKNNEN